MVEAVKSRKENKMALEIKDESASSKQTKPSNNRVHFILDESGSMTWAAGATIDGFNEYINGLKKDKNGNQYTVSLTKFEGGNIETVFEEVDVNEVEPLTNDTYCPCGGTNLNDAIGSVMTNMKKTKPSGKVNTLIIVMTDGQENMSQEWTADSVAKLVKEREKKGWTVTFLGANIDTQKVSKSYSIQPSNTKSYSTANMASTMRGLSEATTVYACSATLGSSSSDFFSGTSDWTETESDNQVGDLSVAPMDINSTFGVSTMDINSTLGINVQDSLNISTPEDTDEEDKNDD